MTDSAEYVDDPLDWIDDPVAEPQPHQCPWVVKEIEIDDLLAMSEAEMEAWMAPSRCTCGR